jgi:hypothetical protein
MDFGRIWWKFNGTVSGSFPTAVIASLLSLRVLLHLETLASDAEHRSLCLQTWVPRLAYVVFCAAEAAFGRRAIASGPVCGQDTCLLVSLLVSNVWRECSFKCPYECVVWRVFPKWPLALDSRSMQLLLRDAHSIQWPGAMEFREPLLQKKSIFYLQG